MSIMDKVEQFNSFWLQDLPHMIGTLLAYLAIFWIVINRVIIGHALWFIFWHPFFRFKHYISIFIPIFFLISILIAAVLDTKYGSTKEEKDNVIDHITYYWAYVSFGIFIFSLLLWIISLF